MTLGPFSDHYSELIATYPAFTLHRRLERHTAAKPCHNLVNVQLHSGDATLHSGVNHSDEKSTYEFSTAVMIMMLSSNNGEKLMLCVIQVKMVALGLIILLNILGYKINNSPKIIIFLHKNI